MKFSGEQKLGMSSKVAAFRCTAGRGDDLTCLMYYSSCALVKSVEL